MELPYISQFTVDLFLGTFTILCDLAFAFWLMKFFVGVLRDIFIKE
jgi:hypothetical protein